MNRLYKVIGVGLISLPLILGFGKAKEHHNINQDKEYHLQLQENVLVGKLEKITKELHLRLSNTELTDFEYNHFVRDLVNSYGILEKKTVMLTDDERYIAELFRNKLSTKKIRGIKDDYILLESTPLSEYAQKDIKAYKRLKSQLVLYLEKKIGKDSIYFNELIFEAIDYVSSSTQDSISRSRIVDIVYPLISDYKNKFNISSEEGIVDILHKRVLDRDRFRKALDKIK